jgi:hypothetical protein
MRARPCRPRSIVLVLCSAAASAHAQPALELPQPSPHARTEQRVGVTDFAIDYSSPGVKGRKIWGDLLPYDKLWRAGANQATKLVASREFTFGNVVVKAGTYSVFATPGKAQWTIVLNTDTTATQDSHDAKNDVAKIVVTPTALPAVRERLLWYFTNTTEDKTSLDLEWERLRIRIPISVDTRTEVKASIEQATNDAWRPHFASANYLFEAGELDRALGFVDKSIAIQSTWRNEWLRAQIEAKKGNTSEAKAGAARAQQLGKDDPVYETSFKATIAKTIATWK